MQILTLLISLLLIFFYYNTIKLIKFYFILKIITLLSDIKSKNKLF